MNQQGNVIDLDSRRRKTYEHVYCLFCGTLHVLVHAVIPHPLAYHGPCPGCDEQASVPLWRVAL